MSNAFMQPGSGDGPIRWIRFLQAAGLFLLVAVIALRPLVSETYDSEGNSITRAVTELADPSPARTLGFDLAILIAGCLWLLSFGLERRAPYRWTGLEAGLCLLAVAAGVSCYFAGNKRLAINGAVDWICLPILAITLTQLLGGRRQRMLVLSAILASAAVNAAQSYEQYFIGFAETIQQYEADKEAFWAQQGVELDSPTVDAFERRLRSREAGGFFAHSNVAGAYWMLCAFAGIGMIGPRASQITSMLSRPVLLLCFVLAVLVVLGIAGAVFLSGSTGALLAGGFGIVLLPVIINNCSWIAPRRRQLFWISWILAMAGIGAVVAHGLYHDSLPGWSLTFRWQYWKASAAMIADHLWNGVGRENFGRHYTFYKDIASPEEVSNPHNFLVQAAAEWGIIGLLGMLAMLVGVTWHASRLPVLKDETQTNEPSAGPLSLFAALGVGGIVVLGKAILLGSNDANYIYYTTATTALVWFPVSLAFGRIVSDRQPSRIFSLSVAVGLIALLLQDLISFALFVPASATSFFALLAVWVSLPPDSTQHQESQTPFRWVAALVACGLTLGFFAVVAVPVFRCAHWLDRARGRAILVAGGEDPRITAYRSAALADRLDPTPRTELARLLGSAEPENALESVSQAIVRDPHNKSLYRQQSRLFMLAAAKSGTPEFFEQAIASAKTALSLYPADPSGLVFLADTEKLAGEKMNSAHLLHDAIKHYREALALDEKRLPWETIRRFHPQQVEEIHRKLESLAALLPLIEH